MALILCTATGGADFGGGVWDLLAAGPRATEQRWSLAQFPYLITPDVTILNSAAPPATLRLLIAALIAGAVILFPSLGFLFYIFKAKEAR